jgi:hypothetical protein
MRPGQERGGWPTVPVAVLGGRGGGGLGLGLGG